MKTVSALVLCLSLASGNLCAVELPLGVTKVPACTVARGDAQRLPSPDNASQTAAVSAIVEGENTEIPANAEQLQTCANTAVKTVGLRLLVAQPSEGNALFKSLFLKCVEEKQIPVKAYFVALKVEDNCAPAEKTAR